MAHLSFRTPNQPLTSEQIIAGLYRRSLVLPVLSVVFSLGLLAVLTHFLPALVAYGLVFVVALARIAFLARGYAAATTKLRHSLEATTERNAVLSDRERTNREVADEAVQSLYGAALLLDSCLDRLHDEAGVREDVDAAAESLTEVIGQIRRYVLELQPLPPVSDDLSAFMRDLERGAEAYEVGIGNE